MDFLPKDYCCKAIIVRVSIIAQPRRRQFTVWRRFWPGDFWPGNRARAKERA